MSGDDDGDAKVTPALDRAATMEDCSRFSHEAEQSLIIAKAVGEALAVLNCTVVAANGKLFPNVVTAVSAEVASAVTEAEGLVDDLLRVIEVSSQPRVSGLLECGVSRFFDSRRRTLRSIRDGCTCKWRAGYLCGRRLRSMSVSLRHRRLVLLSPLVALLLLNMLLLWLRALCWFFNCEHVLPINGLPMPGAKISSRQDEGGLPPTGSASTIAALAATAQSIGVRRIAAVASANTDDADISNKHGGSGGGLNGGIATAVTALQDCLVYARCAILAVTGAALRVSTSKSYYR